MSLMDALLLDPAPLDVWVALRSDGVKGSGTQSDPYDGSTTQYPSLSITSLTRSGAVATAVTAVDHGFHEGDWITVSGVSTAAGNGDAYYMGPFAVHPDAVDTKKFTYTMLDTPSSATASGTIVCCHERERFDTVMRLLPENTTVRLGPGVFETKGANGLIIGWQGKSGQKIFGGGMGITTLKLVRAEMPESNYFAAQVGGFVHQFELRDFAIDCNIAGQPERHVTCGAAHIPGKHNRVRRVRVINFGSQTKSYVENFVVMADSTASYFAENGSFTEDCIIEDCIAEWPAENPVNNSTIFIAGGGEGPDDGFMSFHRSCVIRNCFIDARVYYGPVVAIDTISSDGTAVTVTTKAPHRRTMPGNVLVQGVTIGGSYSNPFNGLFAIAEISSDTALKYNLNTILSPDAHSGSVGGGVSSHVNPITAIAYDDEAEVCDTLALDPFQEYDYIVRIRTKYPHNRTNNNRVSVGGLFRPDGITASTAFNGSFEVRDHDPNQPSELKYVLEATPDAELTDLDVFPAEINPGHQGLSGDNGIGTVVEGNRVFHCTNAGPYHDSWSTRDLVSRENYYHDVLQTFFQSGPFGPTGGVSATPIPIPLASLTNSGTTATAQTSSAHGFSVLNRVTISGADKAEYNGTFFITDVPAANQFKYTMIGTPSGPASGAGYGTAETHLGPQRQLAGLDYVPSGGKHLAIASIPSGKHGLSIGDWVRVTTAGHFDKATYPNSTLYNGNVKITDVQDTWFEYELSGDPGVDSNTGGPDFCAGYFGRIFQVRNAAADSNVIESAALESEYWHANGLRIYAPNSIVLPTLHVLKAVIRDNIIRSLDGIPVPTSRAIEVYGCQAPLVEHNIIADVDRATPIEHFSDSGVNTFGNTAPDGTLLVSTAAGGVKAPELTQTVRSALWDSEVFAFLFG